MIRHHTIAFQHPATLNTCLKQTGLKRQMSSHIDKQILTIVPTINHVIHSIRLLYT
jgi:hypothetical protein